MTPNEHFMLQVLKIDLIDLGGVVLIACLNIAKLHARVKKLEERKP